MCLVCGSGNFFDNHGDPLNLTYGRLLLIASRHNTNVMTVAENILGTLVGYVGPKNPRQPTDRFEIKYIPGPRLDPEIEEEEEVTRFIVKKFGRGAKAMRREDELSGREE